VLGRVPEPTDPSPQFNFFIYLRSHDEGPVPNTRLPSEIIIFFGFIIFLIKRDLEL
jgi:hypothetical protein